MSGPGERRLLLTHFARAEAGFDDELVRIFRRRMGNGASYQRGADPRIRITREMGCKSLAAQQLPRGYHHLVLDCSMLGSKYAPSVWGFVPKE